MQLPQWALKKAGIGERLQSIKALQNRTGNLRLLNRAGLKAWMREKQWRTNWLTPELTFRKQLFSSDENFALALQNDIVEIWIPKKTHTFSLEDLNTYDKDYKERNFEMVVIGLRAYRRAVEAGVLIEIEGELIRSVSKFYDWVHNRYPLLEEGSDKWIGNDD